MSAADPAKTGCKACCAYSLLTFFEVKTLWQNNVYIVSITIIASAVESTKLTVCKLQTELLPLSVLHMTFQHNDNNNDRLTAFDPGQPG